jgi:hypothetical protein
MRWLSATLIAWVFGFLASFVAVVLDLPPLARAALVGVALGTGQAWALRSRRIPAPAWVVATAAGYLLGVLANLESFGVPRPGEPSGGVVVGVAVGVAQWLVLRGHAHDAAWWVLFSVAGWGIAGLVLPMEPTPGAPLYEVYLGGLAHVAVLGGITGLGLSMLRWDPEGATERSAPEHVENDAVEVAAS